MSLPCSSPSKSDDEFSVPDLLTNIPASENGTVLVQNSPSLLPAEENEEHKTSENQVQELGSGPTENTDDNLECRSRGIVEDGTEELGTDEMGTVELGTDELGTDELGTDELGVVGCEPETQAVDEADRTADGLAIPVGETVDENKEKEANVFPNLEVLDDDSDTVTETIDNLEAFEIDDDDDAPDVEKPSLGVTAPSPPSALPSSSSTSPTSSSASSSLTSSSPTSPDLSTVGPEDLKCDSPGCRHLAHSKAGLVLHLRTHCEFEVKSSVKSGETKFSYINGKYLCSLCPMTTFNRTVFGEHVRHHLLTHPYKCGHCAEGVDSIIQLRQHNRTAHRQLLVKLIINESGRVEAVMSKLGPQAPPTGTDCRPPTAPTERSCSDSAKEPICIDDDGEDFPDVSRSSACVPKPAPAPQPERKEPLSQNFKYSLTKDGRLLCAQCRYMTAEVEAFGNHVFNDIHQALKNPCGKCNQRGKRTDLSHDCTIVDQITRALLRQKELQGVPKDSQEAVQRGGLKVAGAVARKDTDQLLSTERTPAPVREKERPPALPKSPFEETMALLRTLSSENQSDGVFSPEDKAPRSVKKEPASELVMSDSGVAQTAEDLHGDKGSNEVSKDPKDKELPTIRRLGDSSCDLSCTSSLTARKETLVIKNESVSSELKLVGDTDIQKDDSDFGCCRCLVYKATPHKRLSLEELDKTLKDKMDSETVSDTTMSTQYRCGIPGCMFTSNLDLNFKLHCMVKHPGMAALTCSLCQRGFEDEDLLLDHINCEHNQGLGSPVDKGIYLCSVENCGVSFNRVVELKAHFVTGHPHLGSFPCSFCFECLPTLDGIMAHIQTHLINVMKCSYCKKVFNEKDELLGHISASHEGQPKKINICIKIVNNSRLKSVTEGKNKEDVPPHPPPIENLASPGRLNTEKSEERHPQMSCSSEEVEKMDTKEAIRTERNRAVQESPAQQLLDVDVELVEAKEGLAVKCEQCSFTCNTEIQLKMHIYECHTKDRATGLAFTCKCCNMATNVRETLQKHVAHHTGKNVVRFYVCPYCSKQSTQMDLIEDHVMNDHPNEPFKFEVIQDMITYLQDMMLCPVCKGGFTWKQDFLHHIGSVHRLEDLVSYLDSKFPEKPFLRSCNVPRSLFKDLIPAPARSSSPEKRKDEVVVRDQYVNQQNEAACEKSADFGRDGMILRFHCEICEFSINDYPKYREHMASHGNILDDVQNYGVNRLSPLPTSANDIVFGGSGDLYGTVAEPTRRKRMKLTCPLCPFECNKTLNYRRHLAIHERNKFMTDGFKCGYCQFLHDRQNCIKFHLGKYHGHLPPKIVRIVGGREVDVGPDDELMRPSRNAVLQSPSPAVDLSREKRTQKQTNRWSASWESPYTFTGRSRRMIREQRRLINRPMENIAADYMESDLPAGMIYPEPIKCPKCQFSNRVRINLVRHMKLHQNDGDIGLVDETPTDSLSFDVGSVSGSTDRHANDERCTTTNSIAIDKDCIKIEGDDGNFNTFSGRNSPTTLNDSVRCPSARSERSASDVWPAVSDSFGSDVDINEGPTHGGSSVDGGELGGSTKKLFKCCYCSIVSKWNRRDISLHILHVHMQKRVYSCQYCSYGSSKSSAIVMNHCSKIHPQKQIFVRDELALFNAIMPVQEDSSLVSVGFLKPDGVPILDLVELRRHLGLSSSGHQEVTEPGVAEKRTSRTSSSSSSLQKRPRLEDDRDQPLDLSVKIRGASDQNNDKEPEGNGFADPGCGANSGVEFAEWKCKLCKFRNRSANHVKRHILCHHMRLKPFSCPYCHLYQWKAQAVASHIEKFHPGQPKTPVSTANEKVSYLSRNMTRVFVRPGVGPEEQCASKGSGPSSASATDQSRFTGVCSTSFYRCKQCGFQEVRHDKTKYHVIKQHLKLGLFSCPYCRKYMWGRNYVARHIRSTHPGQEIRIQRTFDEYANYLRDNIKKIGGSTVETTRSRFPPVRRDLFRESPIRSPTMNSSSNDAAGTSSDKDRRRQNPSGSSGSATSFKKPQKYYKCFYCSFQHSLAARVQSHCLGRHPTRPVKYRETISGVEEWPVPAKQIKVELTDEENEETQPDPLPAGNDLPQHESPSPVARPALPIEMYMCHYCHHLLWNMEEMMAHLCESHPDDPPEFELMQEPAASSPVINDGSSSLLSKIPKDTTRNASSKVPDNLVEKTIEPRKVINEVNEFDNDEDVEGESVHRPKSSNRNFREDDFVFKCRLCSYHTDKVTVMRHHVMSHLLYHPYRCPYCEHAHSVKSSPITKHIKLKHPGMDPQFTCARDEEMERQVRSTYYRTVRDGTESTVPVKSFRKLLTIPLTPKMRKPSRRAFYKCKFCGLVTHIRTDMKHHLMREIHYKPFVCGYCNYTEPSRSGMGKHFRSKHCGMVIDIRCTHDAQEDARVEQMLEDCVTRHDPDSVIDSPVLQTDAGRKNEPFKLLTKKLPSETMTMHGGSALNPFGSSGSSRFGVFPGFFGSHGKGQKSYLSSRAPKIHRCMQCSYSSTSLRPLQAHMVKHRPCRLQCGYCTHRSHYPSWIRKHIRSSHPGLAFKYCKVASGPKVQAAEVKQEIGFGNSPAPSVASIPSPSPPPPLPTPSPPPVSKPVAVLSSIGKKSQKQQQAPALLDGVELDIALVPGRDGYYRCPQCDYQTANRSHYKMHSVIHKPRKWKCFYCNHKFPLIFRLRRHCSLKHPRLPVKWVDVATEQVCDDSTRLHAFRHYQSNSPSSTARKSFQNVPRLKVALFRSRKSSSPKLSALSNDELTIDLDFESSRSQNSVDLDSSSSSGRVLWFCCPNCPKKYSLLPLFVDHMKSAHTATASFPALEILPPMGEGELTLQRCGFCSYESFFKEDFDVHVKGHTSLRPRKCGHCQFASFVLVDLDQHSMESHPNLPVEFDDLDQPYTMNSNDQSIPDERVLYNFDPTVKLVDVCKILQDKWESV